MTKEKEVKILYINDEGDCYERTVTNDLKTLQDLVGGYIEVVYIDDLICIVNEEWRFLDFEPVFAFEVMPDHWDVIPGKSFFIGDAGEEFRSLSEEETYKAFSIYSVGKRVWKAIQERKSKANG